MTFIITFALVLLTLATVTGWWVTRAKESRLHELKKLPPSWTVTVHTLREWNLVLNCLHQLYPEKGKWFEEELNLWASIIKPGMRDQNKPLYKVTTFIIRDFGEKSPFISRVNNESLYPLPRVLAKDLVQFTQKELHTWRQDRLLRLTSKPTTTTKSA